MAGRNREKIYGRHPAREAITAGRRQFFQTLVAAGSLSKGSLGEVVEASKRAGIPVVEAPKEALDEVNVHHQGVVVEASPYPYVSLSQILDRTEQRGHKPLVLLLDMIQDPQNLGTLLRTGEAVGVDGVIIPYRRRASITPAVVSASAGACEHLWVAQENLARSIEALKEAGLWIVGLDAGDEAQRLGEIDLSGALGLVVGNENAGLRRLVKASCDFLLRLPMQGKVESLNAAVAGSVVLYAVWQTRGFSSSSDGGEKRGKGNG